MTAEDRYRKHQGDGQEHIYHTSYGQRSALIWAVLMVFLVLVAIFTV